MILFVWIPSLGYQITLTMNIKIRMIASLHAKLQNMDVKPVPMRRFSSAPEMAARFVFTQTFNVMAIHNVITQWMNT